jgi:hypothetical protein
MKAIGFVIINEQHKLFEEQESILEDCFDSYDFIKVPADGWDLDKIDSMIDSLAKTIDNGILFNENVSIVFASPIPAMIKRLINRIDGDSVFIFHNDKRNKKELPNGKIIQVVSDTGWQLV